MSKINFKEFDKPELLEVLELFMSLNLLPSLESHLIRTMNNNHFNRITDERNKIVIKLQKLFDKKRKSKQDKAQEQKLYNQLLSKDKVREKRLKKMLDLEIVSQEEYNNLTILNK
ncbi:hypothetical protein [Halarcobacter sp.]|uniref:hypothetical protein n=1 Tax=Halarcobacter sp. TaxID=2321133 RepID=UPI0029F49FC6|nr:hypothetical protein [Halarcobacter sp.]